jgi:hypothetical protein
VCSLRWLFRSLHVSFFFLCGSFDDNNTIGRRGIAIEFAKVSPADCWAGWFSVGVASIGCRGRCLQIRTSARVGSDAIAAVEKRAPFEIAFEFKEQFLK